MKNFLKHIYVLGLKEIKSFFNDKVFIIFVVWAFTINIVISADAGDLDVKNAPVAVVNEDNSYLSRNIINSLRQPRFKNPVLINYNEIDANLDSGKFVFVIVIPENFQSDILSQKETKIQLNIDATTVSQSYIGSNYIKSIINKEISKYLKNYEKNYKISNFEQVIRVKYNSNRRFDWFMSLSELIMMGTILSMMLPAVALMREKEFGTIEHLLVMPITPKEIMFSKIWSSVLIIIIFAIGSLILIIKHHYGLKIQGSLFLFFTGFLIFQFSITSLGITLATFARNTAQLALLAILVMMPMVFLSGAFTPTESMSPFIQKIMFLSPLKHCMDFSYGVVFRGSDFLGVWKPMFSMVVMGIILFTISSLRFTSWFNNKQ